MVNSELHHCGYKPGHTQYFGDFGLSVEADYALIQGNRITSNCIGVILNNSGFHVVIDNYIADNYMDGVRLNHSNNNTVMGNTLDANSRAETGYGYSNVILDHSSNNNWIIGNDVTNSYNWFSRGITVNDSSNNNTVEDNFVYSNQWAGIAVYSSQYNVIHHNVVLQTRLRGVEVRGSDNMFTENIVNENDRGFYMRGDCHRNNFTNNTANKNGIGFVVYAEYGNAFNNVFLRNIAEENTESGFYIEGLTMPPYVYRWANFNLFDNNTARNNTNGFTVLTGSEYNNFTGNFVEGNDVGFELNGTKNNIFSNNTVVGSDYGYHMIGGSRNNQFFGETLEDNGYHVYLNETVNSTFFSSTLKDCLVGDLYLNSSSELNLFNVSFSALTIDATSILNIKNYLRVRVVDSFGNPLPGTDVEVVSFGGGFQGIEYATAGYGGSDPRTGGGGYTPWFLVTNTTYPGSSTPVLRTARVYVKSGMVIFPGVPVTVDLVEPQTLTISGVLVLLPFSVMLGLMSAGGSSASLYVGVGAVILIALAGVAVYFLRFRK